ncbi:MAG: hypothetical protein J7L71_11370 [Spirochaetaceae bacterium]|nr:hypothetical protein [Spirochaetaceae bacterium]
MKNSSRFIAFLIMVSSIVFVLSGSTLASDEATIPIAEFPVLTTSAGQSADINTLNIIADEAGLKYDYCDVPTVEMIDAGVGLGGAKSGPGFHVEILTDLEKYPIKTPYKTIIFAIGASMKGMGASGLTIDDEIKRLKNIIEYCKKNKIFIIAVHVGGLSKRGAPGSDNEKMIDAVAPFADYIIVTKDGNKDGRFTAIAEKNKINLTVIDYALDLVDVLKQVFQLGE